jgi:hypothetical protein
MAGWSLVVAIVVLELATTAILIRVAVRRWRDLLYVAVIAVILGRPVMLFATGDISRFLPHLLWSEGADGKDQIAVASAASTILTPLIAAAGLLLFVKLVWTVVVGRRQKSG